jgi:hypothetical protein
MANVLTTGPTDPLRSIQMGDTITVTFEDHGPTPAITGIIRFFDDATATLMVEIEGVSLNVIKNYAYFTKSLV